MMALLVLVLAVGLAAGDRFPVESSHIAALSAGHCALAREGLSVDYRQVSSCGGIYTVRTAGSKRGPAMASP